MPEPSYDEAFAKNAAENYERYFVPVIGRPVAEDLVDAAALRPGERVLDVALCGMGLQFFSDRSAGLREIRRVLAPGGRLVANLPGPAPPPLEIMGEEIARHLGAESAAFVHVVFSLHDPDEIRALATDAGFGEVDVRAGPRALHLPPPGDFLWQYIHSTPLAAAVGQLDEEGRTALERDYEERCAPFVQDGALTGAVNMTTVTTTR